MPHWLEEVVPWISDGDASACCLLRAKTHSATFAHFGPLIRLLDGSGHILVLFLSFPQLKHARYPDRTGLANGTYLGHTCFLSSFCGGGN